VAHQTQNYTMDTFNRLKSAGAVAADAAGTVAGQPAYVDFGGPLAYAEFDVIVDWTACEVDDGDEVYLLELQGSDSSTFSTYHVLAERRFGALSGKGPAANTPPVGRAVLRGDNLALIDSASGAAVKTMRYLRAYLVVQGSVSTGFDYSASLHPKQ